VIRRACALGAFLLLGALVGACQRVVDAPAADASRDESRGQVQRYVFGTTDGEEISAESMHGRVTLLLFVTTFDLASQVAAKRVNQVLHAHRPRINAAAVVLEAAKYAPLAEVFKSTLELGYPVAIADLELMQRSSTLGDIDRVPTLLVLDAQGREMFRENGNFTVEEIDGWLDRAAHR